MPRVFISPLRYVQGPNVLVERVDLIADLGSNVLMLADDFVWDLIGKDYASALEEAGLSVYREPFEGECSRNEIARVVEIGKEQGVDVVIGLGGGKAIDSCKAIADDLGAGTVVAPTIASSDAPTSALSVIYTDDGNFESYRFYKKNPDLVIVDSQIIANAPVSFLRDGIGDASATYVEAMATKRSDSTTMAGGRQTLAAVAIAETSRKVLFEKSKLALSAVEAGVVTEALEDVIEANTLLSGLGFESSGLSGAHAIHNALTAIEGPVHEKTHGEKVAYGVLTQLFLENADAKLIDEYIEFYQSIGLPTTLAEVNLDQISEEEFYAIGEKAIAEGETSESMVQDLTPKKVVEALKGVDIYVRTAYSNK